MLMLEKQAGRENASSSPSYEFTIWSASIKTVFNENFLPQYTKRSSRLGPSKSRTSTLSSPLTPDHFIPGIPPERR